jgi:hypothetical protein
MPVVSRSPEKSFFAERVSDVPVEQVAMSTPPNSFPSSALLSASSKSQVTDYNIRQVRRQVGDPVSTLR